MRQFARLILFVSLLTSLAQARDAGTVVARLNGTEGAGNLICHLEADKADYAAFVGQGLRSLDSLWTGAGTTAVLDLPGRNRIIMGPETQIELGEPMAGQLVPGQRVGDRLVGPDTIPVRLTRGYAWIVSRNPGSPPGVNLEVGVAQGAFKVLVPPATDPDTFNHIWIDGRQQTKVSAVLLSGNAGLDNGTSISWTPGDVYEADRRKLGKSLLIHTVASLLSHQTWASYPATAQWVKLDEKYLSHWDRQIGSRYFDLARLPVAPKDYHPQPASLANEAMSAAHSVVTSAGQSVGIEPPSLPSANEAVGVAQSAVPEAVAGFMPSPGRKQKPTYTRFPAGLATSHTSPKLEFNWEPVAGSAAYVVIMDPLGTGDEPVWTARTTATKVVYPTNGRPLLPKHYSWRVIPVDANDNPLPQVGAAESGFELKQGVNLPSTVAPFEKKR